MRKKVLVLKKCEKHRVGIVVFSIFIFAVLTACVLVSRSASAVLLYIPLIIFNVPLTLYYLTWQIRFGDKEIVKSVFFRASKRYSYSMLRKADKSYSTSEHSSIIRMYFADGKTLKFRMDDENAAKAEKKILRHCSIKIL